MNILNYMMILFYRVESNIIVRVLIVISLLL